VIYSDAANGAITINEHEEGALIASGMLSLMGADAETVSQKLAAALDNAAQLVDNAGGIIGHLKAIVAQVNTRMLSTTAAGGQVAVKVSPQSEVQVNLVMIVFLVEKSDLQNWAEQVMAALR